MLYTIFKSLRSVRFKKNNNNNKINTLFNKILKKISMFTQKI